MRGTPKYRHAATKYHKARAMRREAYGLPTIGAVCRMITASYRVRLSPLRARR